MRRCPEGGFQCVNLFRSGSDFFICVQFGVVLLQYIMSSLNQAVERKPDLQWLNFSVFRYSLQGMSLDLWCPRLLSVNSRFAISFVVEGLTLPLYLVLSDLVRPIN